MKRVLLNLVLLIPLYASAGFAEPDFILCYDFGCKSTQELQFNASHWRQISAEFDSVKSDSSHEKQAIRRAIALMERISGKLTGTSNDKAGNYPGYELAKQMDCIDESTNTFQYLLALQQRGLLRWHRVGLKQRRIRWFISHWTATVVDIRSLEKFAVDSWYRDNGEMPYLQPLQDWQRKRKFPVNLNPELANS